MYGTLAYYCSVCSSHVPVVILTCHPCGQAALSAVTRSMVSSPLVAKAFNRPENFRRRWERRLQRGEFGLLFLHDSNVVGYSWANFEHFEALGKKRAAIVSVARRRSLPVRFIYRRRIPREGLGTVLTAVHIRGVTAPRTNNMLQLLLVFQLTAKRFKEKVGATPVELRSIVALFNRWHRDTECCHDYLLG